MVLVAVGCTTETTITGGGTVPPDTSVPPVVTPDTSTPKADTNKPLADSGPAIPDPPACYNVQGQRGDIIAAFEPGAGNQFAFGNPLPSSSGACSAADVTALSNALSPPAVDGGARPDGINLQFELAGLSGVSASCKTCAGAEYNTTTNPSHTKWGISGSLWTSMPVDGGAPKFDFAGGNPLGDNDFGCRVNAGEITLAQAQAAYQVQGCYVVACGGASGGCGGATPAENNALFNECASYALEFGACKAKWTADAQAVLGGGSTATVACTDTKGVVNTFCGTRSVVTDAGVGQ